MASHDVLDLQLSDMWGAQARHKSGKPGCDVRNAIASFGIDLVRRSVYPQLFASAGVVATTCPPGVVATTCPHGSERHRPLHPSACQRDSFAREGNWVLGVVRVGLLKERDGAHVVRFASR